MTEYKPGQVAVVTWDNASQFRKANGWSDVKTERAMLTADGYWSLASAWRECVDPAVVTDVRPLVALDLAVASYAATALEGSSDNGDRYCAKQIRDAMPKPPRIPEPGLWGVVEASIGDERFTFTGTERGWVCLDDGALWEWDRLDAPTELRPGIIEDED